MFGSTYSTIPDVVLFSHDGRMSTLAHSTREVPSNEQKNIFIYVLLAFALSMTLTVLSRMNDDGGESLKGTSASETSWLQMKIQP